MRMLAKSLLTISAALSLAPTAALALPPQCDNSCWVPDCDQVCYIGYSVQMTCAEYYGYVCVAGAAVTEPRASLTVDEASQVCSEETPAAEVSVSADS